MSPDELTKKWQEGMASIGGDLGYARDVLLRTLLFIVLIPITTGIVLLWAATAPFTLLAKLFGVKPIEWDDPHGYDR